MNGQVGLEAWLERWMAGEAPSQAPDSVLEKVEKSVASSRQRPVWLATVLVPAMRRRRSVAVGSPRVRAIAIVLAAGLLMALVAGAGLVGAHVLLPDRATPAGINGLIGFDAGFDIFVANSDGSGRRALTADARADTDPTWSPDGTRLAFWSRPGRVGPIFLVLVAPDGGGRSEIHAAGPISFPETTGGHPNISWQPSGAKLAVLGSIAGRGVPVVIDPATSGLKPLDVGGLDVFTLDWSPDGSLIAFVGDDARGRSIWVVRPDGSGLRQVRPPSTGDADYTSVSWSADSRRLAFTRLGADLTHDLLVVDVVTGAETLVATGGDYYWPSYSPDGAWIAFGSGPAALHVVRPDGSGSRTITTPPIGTEDIAWSPDGTRILVFAADLTGLDVVPLDGGAVVTIEARGNVGSPSWQRLP